MLGRYKNTQILRAVAGGTLVGFGFQFLFANLSRVAAQLTNLLGISTREEMGTVPSVILAASQAAQAYGVDHEGVLLGLLRVSASFWPLLLVIAGALLLWDVVAEKAKASSPPNPYCTKILSRKKLADVDFVALGSTCK
jgi:hypothetical protein